MYKDDFAAAQARADALEVEIEAEQQRRKAAEEGCPIRQRRRGPLILWCSRLIYAMRRDRLQLVAALVVALLLSLFASDLLARPAARATDEPGLSRQRRNPLARNVEWIGMNLGGGVHHFDVEDGNSAYVERTHFSLKSDVLLFNLHWPRFYWTVLELHPTLLLGYFGGGTRLGARIAIADDLSHELRCGAFLGLDFFMSHPVDLEPTFTIGPHAEYVYNTRHGSVGLGIEVPINFLFVDRIYGHDNHGVDVPPALIGVVLYFRWSVWRMTW